jgi:molybdenum cofactor guanylyltransferase
MMLPSVPTTHPATLGLVLAGGLARRMGGGDKAFIEIGGVGILDRVLARLRPACADVIISANGDPGRFVRFGAPVIADSVPDFPGPLAGILSGLDWAAQNSPAAEWLVSAPGDCPFLPDDLAPRLHAARQAAGTPLACAKSAGRLHPVIGLWPVSLREEMRRALVDEGVRKVELWASRHGVAVAEWPATPIDPFFNVNTAEDMAEAERIARTEGALAARTRA